ncbi:hypothetical protein FQA47_001885 [Oryzias melastigma]|uniref:Uncharacterized protein n=1 Tax=Oryzias melastigma TaxID=30732 RepID=A0A834FH23_ORYME|nr:hypothetical protein FQA47_001885 [Oryzias melastigma]
MTPTRQPCINTETLRWAENGAGGRGLAALQEWTEKPSLVRSAVLFIGSGRCRTASIQTPSSSSPFPLFGRVF